MYQKLSNFIFLLIFYPAFSKSLDNKTILEIGNDEELYSNNNETSLDQNVLEQLKSILNVVPLNIDEKTEQIVEYTAPQFMTDLYQVISKNNDFKSIPYGSSVILSLPEKDPSVFNYFKFNLPDISPEDILEAELHVFRIDKDVSLHTSPYFFLRLYQILPNNMTVWNPDLHQLLNVHYIPSSTTGWHIFKVKRTLESWLNSTTPNLGFLITASTVINEQIEIQFARTNKFKNEFQPTLIIFMKLMEEKTNELLSSNEKFVTNTDCSKKPFYMNLTSNPYFNFILYPKGYEAYQCLGECNSLNPVQSPNYSLFKNIFKNLGYPSKNLCCVVDKMNHLIILYWAGEILILQLVKDMIVESCSCR